jgi:triphosphoribosyl-dephospho-CoA synthase
MLSVGVCVQLACIWETTARNPGNAHRYRDFADVSYVDFLLSAAAVAPVFEAAGQRRVGETVLEAIRATRRVTAANTNLGVVLLLAPMAAVPAGEDLRGGLARVLGGLDVEDARLVYRAIRLAGPAGLGEVAEQDIGEEPTETLLEVMSLARERDLVARQYADGYREVFDDGLPELLRQLDRLGTLEDALIACHLFFMANYPDSLIARKRGLAEAEEAASRARQALEAGAPRDRSALAELDAWLRGVERGRNPGTSADLVTACLFAALRQGIIAVPCPYPWSAGSNDE